MWLINYGNNLQRLAGSLLPVQEWSLRGEAGEGIQRNSLLLKGINSGMLKVGTDNPSGSTWPGLRMSLKYFSKAA